MRGSLVGTTYMISGRVILLLIFDRTSRIEKQTSRRTLTSQNYPRTYRQRRKKSAGSSDGGIYQSTETAGQRPSPDGKLSKQVARTLSRRGGDHLQLRLQRRWRRGRRRLGSDEVEKWGTERRRAAAAINEWRYVCWLRSDRSRILRCTEEIDYTSLCVPPENVSGETRELVHRMHQRYMGHWMTKTGTGSIRR